MSDFDYEEPSLGVHVHCLWVEPDGAGSIHVRTGYKDSDDVTYTVVSRDGAVALRDWLNGWIGEDG